MDTYCSPQARARQHEHATAAKVPFKWTASRFIRISLAICMLPLFLHGLSVDWVWPQAWFVSLSQIVIFFAASRHIWIHNPSLFTEREKFTRHEGTAAFDKVLATGVVAVTPFLYLAAGLQHRFSGPWNHSLTTNQAAVALIDILSICLQCWAMISNYWFSSVVRIQTDRGHRVCQSGPYSFVRHPGYVGAAVQPLCEAYLLSSSWCLVVAVVRIVILLVRTVLEDAMLQQQLAGYADYARKVRCRWVPCIW